MPVRISPIMLSPYFIVRSAQRPRLCEFFAGGERCAGFPGWRVGLAYRALFEKQFENHLYVLMLTVRIPDWRNVGISQSLIKRLALSIFDRTGEKRIVMR